jgi:membrane protease YdiL (CAAX protease family)
VDDEHAPRPPVVRLAATFYAAMAAAAFVWAAFQGRLPFWVGAPPDLASVGRWAAVGVLFGLAVVILSHQLARFEFARHLAETFRAVLGPLSWRESFLLALFSGVAEELLFRGALQPTLGLGLTSVLFMFVHWPMNARLIPWTLSAGLMGLAFGWAFERSGHVVGPVVAHFVINLINLRGMTREP